MREITETEAMRHISISRNLPAETAAIRLWAITQLFFRHSVGTHAAAELRRRIGEAGCGTLFYATGFVQGGYGHPDFSVLLPPLDGEKL